jgi:endonuclease YncB( thermonuclease family)
LEEKKYGLASKEYVKSHMPIGSIQTLVTVKDATGKYGRILGKFKLDDGTILNDKMIREHHAVAYYGQSKDDIEEEHIKNRSLVVL